MDANWPMIYLLIVSIKISFVLHAKYKQQQTNQVNTNVLPKCRAFYTISELFVLSLHAYIAMKNPHCQPQSVSYVFASLSSFFTVPLHRQWDRYKPTVI